MPNSRVIIIGGGFAGTMVAVNLIHKTTDPLHIYIIEKTGNLARGVAYSTPEDYHLLNVPGNNMGAFAENPEHFLNWLKEHESLWRNASPAFAELPIEAGRFYPRKLYGIYLEHVFNASIEAAKNKNVALSIIKDEAVDITITEHRTAVIHLAQKGTLPEAGHVVIATGNTPVKSFAYTGGIFLCKDRYIENMWAPSLKSNILAGDNIAKLPDSTRIAIVGTGLTMVDAFLSLRKKGFKGKITAISRHGKLPHPHKSVGHYKSFLDKQHYPTSAYDLFLAIRKEAKKAQKEGHDWRAVLHELRPITNEVWAQLPAKERRYITERLMSYWNIHRHRVPAEVLSLINSDRASGWLTIIPGTIYYIGGRNDSPLTVSYRKWGGDFIEYFTADYVINCSGPETDIARSGNPFLLKLRDKGIINVGTLRTGIELTPSGRVRGKAPDIFHAVGALLVGEKLESTAVPDIRGQASDTAKRILSGEKDEDYSRYYNYFI